MDGPQRFVPAGCLRSDNAKMKQSDIAGRVAAEIALSKADAEVAVNAVLETLSDALARGESVSISGFGTFSVKRGAAGAQTPDGRSDRKCGACPPFDRRLSFRHRLRRMWARERDGRHAPSRAGPHEDCARRYSPLRPFTIQPTIPSPE